MRRRSDAAVGSWVLIYDVNRRVYPRDEKGRSCSGPIERYYYVPAQIISETKRSWVLSYEERKYPKADPLFYGIDDVEEALWVRNSWKIAEMVRNCCDFEKLRQIASIVGFKSADEALIEAVEGSEP